MEVNVEVDHQPLANEITSHFNDYINNSHPVLVSIVVALVFLVLLRMLAFIYFHRLKNIKRPQLLEEFLYYDQINKLKIANNEILRPIKELHLNRDHFLSELKRGLAKNQFVLHYQPIMNANTEEIIDMKHYAATSDAGLLSPAAFLPYSEHMLMVRLGMGVSTKHHQICQWHEMGCSR